MVWCHEKKPDVQCAIEQMLTIWTADLIKHSAIRLGKALHSPAAWDCL